MNIDCHGAVLVSAEYQQCLFHNPAEVDTTYSVVSANSSLSSALSIENRNIESLLQLSEQNDSLIISVFSCLAQCLEDRVQRWMFPMSRGFSQSLSRRHLIPEPELLKLRR